MGENDKKHEAISNEELLKTMQEYFNNYEKVLKTLDVKSKEIILKYLIEQNGTLINTLLDDLFGK